MLKMTEQQATHYVANQGYQADESAELVRCCHKCSAWAHVDDYNGDNEICDDCESAGQHPN